MSQAEMDDQRWWREHFNVDHDPTGLYCEANIFRYRSLPSVVLRIGQGASDAEVVRVRHAAETAGCRLIESTHEAESDDQFASRLLTLEVERVRLVGGTSESVHRAASQAGIHIADGPVTISGRLELLHYVREQAISHTLHRFGNLVETKS